MFKILNKLGALAFTAIFCASLASQENNATILPPILKSKKIALSFQDYLRSSLENTMASADAYRILEREDTDYMIKEYQKKIQRGALLDKSLIQSIGEALGVDVILTSELQLLKNNKLYITCCFINVFVNLEIVKSNYLFSEKQGPFIRAAEIVTENNENAFRTACAALIKKLDIKPVHSFKPLEVLSEPHAPPYPPSARRAGVQGMVELEIIVGADGSPQTVRSIKGAAALRGSAIEHAKTLKFKPAIINNQPVMCFFDVTTQYVLEGKPPF